ncbi:hypothetical protein PFISCL1PPCAC_8185, partial [Pristionchus fissidentatus]
SAKEQKSAKETKSGKEAPPASSKEQSKKSGGKATPARKTPAKKTPVKKSPAKKTPVKSGKSGEKGATNSVYITREMKDLKKTSSNNSSKVIKD